VSDETVFTPGTEVTCDAFRGVGQIAEGPNGKGEYKVALGSLTLWIKGDQLKLHQKKTGSKSAARKKKLLDGLSGAPDTSEPVQVDLHGLKTIEAIDALERAIDQAIMKNASRIEIIHGIGSGTLKHAVKEYLLKCAHISKHHLDEHNPGTTWAYL